MQIIKEKLNFQLNDIALEILNVIQGMGYLAGGAIKDLYLKQDLPIDYDIFLLDIYYNSKVIQQLKDIGYQIEKESSCAVTLRRDNIIVQIVKIWKGIPEKVLSYFDFSICRIATDGINLWKDENFEKDIKDKKLIINKCQRPYQQMLRIIKYLKKGYNIDLKEIIKVFHAYKNSSIEDIEYLENLLLLDKLNQMEEYDLSKLIIHN